MIIYKTNANEPSTYMAEQRARDGVLVIAECTDPSEARAEVFKAVRRRNQNARFEAITGVKTA